MNRDERGRFIRGHSLGDRFEKGQEPWNKGLKTGITPWKGKSRSLDTKRKISLSKKGISFKHEGQFKKGQRAWNKGRKLPSLSEEHKLKLREAAIIYFQEKRNIPYPCIGENEKEIIDKVEEVSGINFIRQYQESGYFIDGYNPIFRIAIEVDEKQHFNNKNELKGEDILRQNMLENSLGCSFIRIPCVIGGD